MHAAVCLRLRGGSGGHQLRRARLSLRSAAGALLRLQRPARHHTLPAPDQQVRSQRMLACRFSFSQDSFQVFRRLKYDQIQNATICEQKKNINV